MPLYGDSFLIVRVDRVTLAFAKQCETVFFQVTDKIPPLDGHLDLGGDLFQERAADGNLLLLLAVSQDHLAESVLEHSPAIFEGLPFGYDFGPFDELANIAGFDLGVFGRVSGEHGPPPLPPYYTCIEPELGGPRYYRRNSVNLLLMFEQ